ncbi:MAG TPA: ATP-binding cassette domain-containing protein [Trebonia sp.]|nr:ATP-binding cassette domain-containing protein [Trebonia sp.]
MSFSVRPGLVTGFLGPNGAGKTTTMRMILGLDAPTQGSVTVGGRSYRDLPAPMREVGASSALLGDPAVLIFDEPVNSLDPDGIHWVRTLLRALAAEGRTVLLQPGWRGPMKVMTSPAEVAREHLMGAGRGLANEAELHDLFVPVIAKRSLQ